MNKDEALKLALEKFEFMNHVDSIFEGEFNFQINAIKEALAQPEPVAWKYDVTYNQDGTVSVALPDGDELRIVLPSQQEPYCWTWDVWVSGGKWRAEYGWKKPTEKVVNLQPLYTAPPQRKPLSDEDLIECEQLAGIRHRVHMGSIRGQQLSPADEFLWHYARAIEAKLKEKNT